ncbi:uncharacterized protein LOC130362240 [Hyla sarda]|uniref:uncharacterized protein LOC130362240 n=1 Tax=Hyla sarda TaxID=327740 RepID=UPI0024C25182|nr:uncharacterized protein LOC130362240 [Hyla sarda]
MSTQEKSSTKDLKSMTLDEIQSLVNESVSRSVQRAMTTLQETIARSVALAIDQAMPQQSPLDQFWSAEDTAHSSKGCKPTDKSIKKRHIILDDYTPSKLRKLHKKRESEVYFEGSQQACSDDIGVTLSHPEPSAREEVNGDGVRTASNRVKADSYMESSNDFSTIDYEDSDPEDSVHSQDICEDSDTVSPNPVNQDIILDSNGIPYFDPSQIKPLSSGERVPHPQILKYLNLWIRKGLDKTARNKLRAECPRPTLPLKAAVTPDIDPILIKYLIKSGKNPKKGLDRSFKACQDKFLDLLGPLTKILDLSEEAASTGNPVDVNVLKGLAQRAICMFGNTNAAFCAERRRAILMKLDPQLCHLATSESRTPTDGMLFGESFIKEISKFVRLSSTLDKAQASLKFFGRAGRSRDHFPSRNSQFRQTQKGPSQTNRPSYPIPYTKPSPFFPTIEGLRKSKGRRDFTRFRPSAAF